MGLIDEFSLSLSPALFGSGTRLFEGVDAGRITLEPVRAEPSPKGDAPDLQRSAAVAVPRSVEMKKSIPAANPDAYVAALKGWRRECVEHLRAAVRKSSALEEVVKWGHLVYLSNGPVLLIRAEDERVLLGFWRGQRLRAVEERLKAGGKFEMASLELREGTSITATKVRQLTREAIALNETHGNPTQVKR